MNTTFRNILLFAGLLLLLSLVWFFRSIVVYILISGVLSIMGRPLVDLFCRIRIGRFSFPRALGALLTLIVIWGFFVIFFSIFVPLLTEQINFFSTIDSDKVVQIIEGPIIYVENIFRSFSK
nr:AI-2E family transporter [Bacteroidales bacterium]